MYIHRESSYPAQGKGRELRALLEERVKAQQASGQAVSLGVQLFAGPEGMSYIRNARHEDLAAYEAARRRNQSDPAFPAYQAKVATLISRPNSSQLFEVLIPNPAGNPLRAPYFTQRALGYPAVGKGPELRAIMEERVKGLQSSGQRATLGVSVYGTDGQEFTTTLAFQDLAALESYRRRNQSDPAFQAYVAKVNPLIRQGPKVELAEVLIPFPS